MSASDETEIVKVAAIGGVAERILQTTSINISKLSIFLLHLTHVKLILIIRSDFNEEIFLMLLRCSFGKHNECQRKMLLLEYFDDANSGIATQSASNTSSFQPSELTEDNSDKGKNATNSSAKKKIILEENETNEEGGSLDK
ncbi:hypothetical protein LIER_22061 [Lithospermum erythrorhizon]|uniref:Uncharacterized protein n=1 Tax=Lithospermum erythrorhizon TaxID=34254 RepID=A0AAV3QY52_LITER